MEKKNFSFVDTACNEYGLHKQILSKTLTERKHFCYDIYLTNLLFITVIS